MTKAPMTTAIVFAAFISLAWSLPPALPILTTWIFTTANMTVYMTITSDKGMKKLTATTKWK